MKKIKYKKAGMGPWPSIIGGIILCIVIILILSTVAGGGIRLSREVQNKKAYSDLMAVISNAWTESTSVTTDWKLLGVNAEAWGIMYIDNTTAHDLIALNICDPKQSNTPCVSAETKSVINKCNDEENDICLCLVSVGTAIVNPGTARKFIVVDPGLSIDASLANIKAWTQANLIKKYRKIDVIDCNLVARELNCFNYYGYPCVLKVNNNVVVWIGTDDSSSVLLETLTATRPSGRDTASLSLNSTVSDRKCPPSINPLACSAYSPKNIFASPDTNVGIWNTY